MTQPGEVRQTDSLAFYFVVTAHSHSPHIHGIHSKPRRGLTHGLADSLLLCRGKAGPQRLTFFCEGEGMKALLRSSLVCMLSGSMVFAQSTSQSTAKKTTRRAAKPAATADSTAQQLRELRDMLTQQQQQIRQLQNQLAARDQQVQQAQQVRCCTA